MMTTSVVLFTSLLLQPIAVPSDGLRGDAAFAAGDYATAYKAWEAQANAGNAAAMLGIGVLYDTGHGVPQNFATALFWYRRAAEAGSATAAFNVGAMYDNGRGTATDHQEAIKWWRVAAMKGHGRAAYNLGVMYRDGNSVRRDRAAAIRFFRLAARNGIPAAQANLAALGAPAEPPSAESGQSLVASRPAVAGSDVEAVARFQKAVLARVTLDRSEAKDFSDYVAIFTREAAKGDHLAQYDLGFALQHGLGIRADPVRAYVYYTRAMASKASDIYAAALTGASEIVTLLNNKQFTAAHEMLFNDTP